MMSSDGWDLRSDCVLTLTHNVIDCCLCVLNLIVLDAYY